jgi:hypothetical protein
MNEWMNEWVSEWVSTQFHMGIMEMHSNFTYNLYSDEKMYKVKPWESE